MTYASVSRGIPLSLALLVAALCVRPVTAAVTSGPEFDTLVAIYDGTDGPNWFNELSHQKLWKVGDACTWFAITCDATGDHIDSIDMYNNNLVGTLPDLSSLTQISNIHIEANKLTEFPQGISALINLRTLVMRDDEMQGVLPSVSALQKLKKFDIQSNQLSQMPNLTGLNALEYVDVSYNAFSGPLPTELSTLPNLAFFNASSNQFDSLSDFSGSVSLVTFMAYQNNLSGPIPPLSALPKLQTLDLEFNFLTGPLPSLANLGALQELDVMGNQLTGPLDLTGLTNLIGVWVGGNAFSGSIPDLSKLPKLQWFEASSNALTGNIPPLSVLSKLHSFEVSNNRLTGLIPSISGLPELYYFWVDNNNLVGPAPKPPSSLFSADSSLCPNALTFSATNSDAFDAAWDIATVGYFPTSGTHWWGSPGTGCDGIFGGSYE